MGTWNLKESNLRPINLVKLAEIDRGLGHREECSGSLDGVSQLNIISGSPSAVVGSFARRAHGPDGLQILRTELPGAVGPSFKYSDDDAKL